MEEITWQDFEKVDLRVGKIIETKYSLGCLVSI